MNNILFVTMWMKFPRKSPMDMVSYIHWNNIFSTHTLRILYYSIICPHLTYNVVIWGGSCITGFRKITISVNKLIRTILGFKYINYQPTLPTLKFDDVCGYYLLLFIHSSLHGSNFEIYISNFLQLIPNYSYNVRNLKIHLPIVD